jgi:hypothetical protein
MSVLAAKPKVKAKRKLTKYDPHRIQTNEDAEAFLREIESDPNASTVAKDLVAFLRKRDKSGEPYMTIEEIMVELGRG